MRQLKTERDGFTLLETLIAFITLASLLTMATQVISLAAKSLSRSKEQYASLHIAERISAERWGMDPGVEQGQENGLQWKTRSTRLAPASETSPAGSVLSVSTLSPSGGRRTFIYFVVTPDE